MATLFGFHIVCSCFCATTELGSCNHVTHKPKMFTVCPFTKNVLLKIIKGSSLQILKIW